MIIREMAETDLLDVVQLARLLFPNSDITFEEDDFVLVAEENDGIVGFLHTSWINDKAVIKGIGVREEYRHQGIGEMMMEVALSKLSNESEIHLKVKIDNLPALRLYEKYGFFLKKYGKALIRVKKQEN